MNVFVYSIENIDGRRKDGSRCVGVSIKGIARDSETNKPNYFKEWVDETHPSYSKLKQKALSVVPGQVIELDYSISGRTAVISDIIPSEELAVDFDSIL